MARVDRSHGKPIPCSVGSDHLKSTLFDTDAYKDTETKIRDFLNAQNEFLSGNTVKSTRAAGDAIADMLCIFHP